MTVLGTHLDHHGHTTTSKDHRLNKAENLFWSYYKTLKGRGKQLKTKLQAWVTTIHKSAVHGSGSWILTKETLLSLRRWELHHLRKVIPSKGQPTRHEYFESSAKYLDEARTLHKQLHLIHTILDNYYRDSYTQLVSRNNNDNNNNLAQTARNYRNNGGTKTENSP